MHCQGVITTHSARTVYKLHQANIQHLAGVVVCTMKGCVVRWTIALDLRYQAQLISLIDPCHVHHDENASLS